MCRAKFCICFMLMLVLTTSIRSYQVEVKVKQGKLIGTRESTLFERRFYYAFYGIPYAQRPVGRLRFKDPQAQRKKWEQPFDASTEYHGACAQAHIVHKHGLYGVEDCLYLNIYTPHPPKNEDLILKPVMVWIHGYAFSSSFSHLHGADFFMENNILFVSVTHRIGVFGFLKVNETDTHANMGLKDIVMALKWIRKNIKRFGGDKKKITLMGSSSAATFISLILTTKYRKFVSKVILQSGSLFSPSIFEGDHNLESARLKEALKKYTQKDVMKASARDIISASQKIYNNKEIINFQKPVVPFSPIIETESNNSLILVKPEDIYKSNKNSYFNMPILIGFNTQESISEAIPFMHNPHHLKSLGIFFKYLVPFAAGCSYNYTSLTYSKIASRIKNKYFEDGISEHSILNFLKYTSDLIKYPIYKFIKFYLNTNIEKIYVYKFNYVGTFNAVKATSMAGINTKIKGAANGDEVCYIMKCEPLWENYARVSKNASDPDRKFIKEISELWANFAKSGDPTPITYSGNTTWLPMTLKDDNILLIGKVSKVIGSKPERNMFKFWNELYDAYYSDEHCNTVKHDEF